MAAVKLKDIAKEAKLSISTVSRILSGDTSRKANVQTVERVMQIAKDLGYFDAQVKKISANTAKTPINVGCVFTSDHESFVSPFFSQILLGIQEELQKAETQFDCRFYTFNLTESGFAGALEDIHLDGAIILGRTSLDTVSKLKRTIPDIVYCGINSMNQGIDEVTCSAYQGVRDEITYLYGLGHHEIGYIGPTDKQQQVFNEHRYRGYIDGLSACGLVFDGRFVEDCYLSAADGYNGLKHMYGSTGLPSALICANDAVAMGVLRAAGELGISVPDRLSLVGFDNVEAAAFTRPSLTTVDVPKLELGHVAVKILLDRIHGGHVSQLNVQIPFSLVERESCLRRI
ncbi:MAG: LacI family transcriptional regulator [Spirochaetia bacterium]|nr:LacI family transcriptional regulator [Spirochaetia bacterium]